MNEASYESVIILMEKAQGNFKSRIEEAIISLPCDFTIADIRESLDLENSPSSDNKVRYHLNRMHLLESKRGNANKIYYRLPR